jgi:hypothetical protein
MALQGPRFQALTSRSTGKVDRILTDIAVLAAPHDPLAPAPGAPAPTLTKALWDTGASKSVITSGLVKLLGLTAVGQVTVNHAGGASQSLTYVVNFMLPNRVAILGALVTEMPGELQHTGFDVILGMDVIGIGDFSITNVGGQTCMSFRTPSLVTVDYVEEYNRLLFAGIGRNDPCACGSGKKFKKCHGA